MANPVVPNLDGTNPGPAGISTVNTQTPYGTTAFDMTIGVTITPVAVATIVTAEQSFGLNGVSFVTAATGIKAGDVITAISSPTTPTVGVTGWRVDATTNDKFYISFTNPTAGSLTPPSGVYLISVRRFILSNASSIPTALVP